MKQKRKAVVILSPGFAAGEWDSTCLPAHQLFVKALQRNYPGVQIVVLAFHYPFVKQHYKWNNIDVTSFNGRSSTDKLKMLSLWLVVWKELRKLKKNSDLIGLLSFWCTDCALVAKYFGKLYGISHYSWITGQDARPGNAFVRFIQPRSKELVAMSDFLAAQFFINYKVHVTRVITNGIDPSVFEDGIVEKNIDVLGAGSLIPLKRYDVFVHVCAALKAHFGKLDIVLCGSGVEEDELRKRTQENNMSNDLMLTGEKSHGEVLRFMQAAKIFLHTSSYEGFSTVCLEALYAGCHVISFIQPMEKDIPHWHIVKSEEEMVQKAISLLEEEQTSYCRTMPYSMDESARQFMQLFGQ